MSKSHTELAIGREEGLWQSNMLQAHSATAASYAERVKGDFREPS